MTPNQYLPKGKKSLKVPTQWVLSCMAKDVIHAKLNKKSFRNALTKGQPYFDDQNKNIISQ